MSLSVTEIVDLLSTRGQSQYGGEAVSQLEHALQCAQLAEQAGESAHNIVAALLHDLGHLLALEPIVLANGAPDRDDLHQFFAMPFLRGLLDEAVLAPIRLHVDAKRCLCALEPGYWDSLSPASKHSLELQGGRYTEAQARDFMCQPFAADALRLRRYDDLAKTPNLPTPPLAHYAALLEGVARQSYP